MLCEVEYGTADAFDRALNKKNASDNSKRAVVSGRTMSDDELLQLDAMGRDDFEETNVASSGLGDDTELALKQLTISDDSNISTSERVLLVVSRSDTAELLVETTETDETKLDVLTDQTQPKKKRHHTMQPKHKNAEMKVSRRITLERRRASQSRSPSPAEEQNYEATLAALLELNKERTKARELEQAAAEVDPLQPLADFVEAVLLAAAATAASASAERDVGPERAKTLRRTILRPKKEAERLPSFSETAEGSGSSSIGADEDFEFDDPPYPTAGSRSRSRSRSRSPSLASSSDSDNFEMAHTGGTIRRAGTLKRRGASPRRTPLMERGGRRLTRHGAVAPAIPQPDISGTTDDMGADAGESILPTEEKGWESESSSSDSSEDFYDAEERRARTFLEALAVRTGEALSFIGNASAVATAPVALLAGPAVAGLISAGGSLVSSGGQKLVGMYGRQGTLKRVDRTKSAMGKLNASNLLASASDRLVREGFAEKGIAKLLSQGVGTILENGMIAGSASLVASGIAASATSAALGDPERARKLLSDPAYQAAAEYLSYVANVSQWLLPRSLVPLADAVGAIAGGAGLAPAVYEVEEGLREVREASERTRDKADSEANDER